MQLRTQEISITKEAPFKEDLLNREECAKILTQIVQHTEGGFTLSINADWGYGKTTFVKMWEKVLQNRLRADHYRAKHYGITVSHEHRRSRAETNTIHLKRQLPAQPFR